MVRRRKRGRTASWLPACLLLAGVVFADPPRGVVRVAMRPEATASDRVVTIADIADVTGGEAALRQRIAGLDVDDPPPYLTTRRVLPNQVKIRLALAGVAADRFEVTGPTTVVRRTEMAGLLVYRPAEGAGVSASRPAAEAGAFGSAVNESTVPTAVRREPDGGKAGKSVRPADEAARTLESRFLTVASDYVRKRLPWDKDDVQIRPLQPVRLASAFTAIDADTPLDAELRSPYPPLGSVTVAVKFQPESGLPREVPVYLDVRRFDDVVIARSRIPAGQTIRAEDLFVDRRDVQGLTDYVGSLEELAGKRAGRPILPLQPLRQADVSDPRPTQRESPVVKARDRVRLQAQAGRLMVSVEAEALQEGRVGDVIRLKNLASQQTVFGRVVARGEARAEL